MKDDTKAILAFATILIVLVAGGIIFAAHHASSKPKLSIVEKTQALIDSSKTADVASATVEKCVSSDGLYGCAVLVAMKNGTGGCAGVIVRETGDTVAAVEPPSAIDAKYCS